MTALEWATTERCVRCRWTGSFPIRREKIHRCPRCGGVVAEYAHGDQERPA